MSYRINYAYLRDPLTRRNRETTDVVSTVLNLYNVAWVSLYLTSNTECLKLQNTIDANREMGDRRRATGDGC